MQQQLTLAQTCRRQMPNRLRKLRNQCQPLHCKPHPRLLRLRHR